MPFDPNVGANQLLYATTRLEAAMRNGSIGVGTGFHFRLDLEDGRQIPLIVTNRHVVEGSTRVTSQIHFANDSGLPSKEIASIIPTDGGNPWFFHDDPSVDLAAISIAPILKGVDAIKRGLYYKSLTLDLIPTQEELDSMNAVESISMVGYPIGLWDHVNNFPILRRGTTASHPSVDFCGRPEGALDIATFPGSSGSPVFVLDQGVFQESPNVIKAGGRLKWLGVLARLVTRSMQGKIRVETIPTAQVAVAETAIPVHIGYYVKAQAVRQLAEQIVAKNSVKLRGSGAVSPLKPQTRPQETPLSSVPGALPSESSPEVSRSSDSRGGDS